MLAFDLQSHSTRSDGTLAPAEVVRAAAAAGVELLALTDHDTVDGVEEAIAAGREHGVRVVPAAELSTIDGEHEDLHVCGYGLDHTSPALLDALERWREDRAARADRMAAALEELGWQLDRTTLDARRAAGPPDRPPAPRPGRLRPPGQRRAHRGRGARPTSAGSSRPTSSPAPRPTAAARPRRSPRPSTSSTPPAASPSGPTRSGTSTRRPRSSTPIDRFAGARPRRRRGLLRHAHARADDLLAAPLRRHGPADHRLGRLPRPRPPALQPLPRVRPPRPRAAAGSDRAAPGDYPARPTVDACRPSSSGSSRASPSSCRSPRAGTCGSSRRSSAGRTRAPRSPRSSSSGRWPRCSSTSATTSGRSPTRGWRRCATRPSAPHARRADGLVPHLRHDPDQHPRPGVQRPDRGRTPAACSSSARRSSSSASSCSGPTARAKQNRELEDLSVREGLVIGLAQVARAHPGRHALGRDDHRRPAARPRPRRRRALLLPALDPRRRALGALPAQGHRRRAAARPSARRSSPRSSRSSSGYASIALPAALVTSPHPHGLRRLPRAPRRRSCWRSSAPA